MIGRTIQHYRILQKIGGGGMGAVYKAENTRLGCEVALKFLSEELLKDPEAVRRLELEARAAASLNHQHICTIHDIADYQGQPFIVMELLEGQTLKDRIAAGALEMGELVHLGKQIAEALEAAHAKRIIHRDIKPSNIFITRHGQAKVLDFGLAKHLRQEELKELTDSRDVLTLSGSVVGTLHYMAPEVLRGGQAEVRSDLWSLGVVLCEMATGKRPFEGRTAYELASAILREPPRPLPGRVDTGLVRVIQRCLVKDPWQRFSEARDVRAALEALGAEAGGMRVAPRLEPAGAIDSLAVLPFENAGGDPDMDYLSDGITDSLIYSMTQLPSVKVVARTTVYRYKGQQDPLQVGRELNVGAVLTGRVAQRGDLLVIGTELVDTHSGWQLWGQQYNRSLKDLLAVQEDIASEISQKLRLQLTQADKKRLTDAYTRDTESFQLFLKGRHFWIDRTLAGLRKSTEYFELALQKDPNFALAHIGLANSCAIMGIFSSLRPTECFSRAREAARKANEIDQKQADPHASLGLVSFHYDWDWRMAEEEFRRALALNPDSAIHHAWYAWYLAAMGRFPEACAEIREALRLEPISVFVMAYAGFVYYLARRYDEAIEQLRQALERESEFAPAHWWLGLAYMENGKYEEAITALQESIRQAGGHPYPTAALAHLYGRLGWSGDEKKMVQQLTEASQRAYVSAFDMALSQSGRGETEPALDWLERAVDERSSLLAYLRVWPMFDNLRSNPRFAEVLRRIGFPDLAAAT